MTSEQVLLSLQNGTTPPVVFLYGEEPYKINEFIQKVKTAFYGSNASTTFCMDQVDGASSSGPEVLELIQNIGLFGSQTQKNARLVVVKRTSELGQIDALSGVLMDAKPGSSPWGENFLILIAESLDGRRKFHQWLKKHGYALEFKKSTDAELLQWVDVMASKLGTKVSPQAKQLLCILSEGSLYRLSGEIQKAWLYLNAGMDAEATQSGCVIEPKHVEAVGSRLGNHQMVELVQACLGKKRTMAFLLTQNLIQSSENALGFVGFLTWAIKYPRDQKIENQDAMLSGLVQLDQQLKTSSSDPQVLVERFIIEKIA